MSVAPKCPHCGAPRDVSRELCAFCGFRFISATANAGAEAQDWELGSAKVAVDWGPPLVLRTEATGGELVALRSHALFDDVAIEVDYCFTEAQLWEQGTVSGALGIALRASSSAGYDVSVTAGGLVSVSRYESSRFAEWLLEPVVHAQVREGLGVTNHVKVTMQGDLLRVALGGREIAALRDGTRRAGAVELQLRPGSRALTAVVTTLQVRSLLGVGGG